MAIRTPLLETDRLHARVAERRPGCRPLTP
jgi:hypothetical protein